METTGENAPRTCRDGVVQAFRRLEARHGRVVFKLEEIVTETLGSWQISMALGGWPPTVAWTLAATIPGAASTTTRCGRG
jgi:hypothetical protein